jgi:hypothetical protein
MGQISFVMRVRTQQTAGPWWQATGPPAGLHSMGATGPPWATTWAARMGGKGSQPGPSQGWTGF